MKTMVMNYLIKISGLIVTLILLPYGCNKDSETNSCKSTRTGNLLCEQASGYRCSDFVDNLAENGIEGGKRYFVLDLFGGLGNTYSTCDKFHIKVSVDLKDTLPGIALDMVISHWLTSDTVNLIVDTLGIYSMEEYIIDLPSLYPHLDKIVIHHPIRLWLTSTGSLSNDENLVGSVLQRVYVETQVGKKE